MKFSIRDLMWLTVVVALIVAWWVDRTGLHASWKSAESESQKAVSAYKESAAAMGQIVEELQKRGVVISVAKGKVVIGPESAFAP